MTARRESLPPLGHVGEKSCRVSDETAPPPGDKRPDPPPLPATRRSAARGRQAWVRSPHVGAASPAVRRVILLIAGFMMLLGVAMIAVQRYSTPVVTDPVLSRPAQDPGDSEQATQRRAFADELFGPEIHDVVDYRDLEPETQWKKMLEVTAGLDDAFIEKNLRFSLNQHFDEVMKDPDAYRGQFLRMRGVIGKNFRAFKLDEPIAGRRDFYRGQISDPDNDSPVVFFDLLDYPGEFDRGYDTVEIDAAFYRMVEFETQKGILRRTPWIIGKTVRVIAAPEHPKVSTTVGLVVIAAFLALFFAIVYLLRPGSARKTSSVPEAGFRNMFEQRRQQPPLTEGEEPPGL